MDIQHVTWKITPVKPLVQSNPHGMWRPEPEDDGHLEKATRKKGLRGSDSEDFLTAKNQLYVNDDGLCYHPAIGFWQGILLACEGRKLGPTGALTIMPQAVALIEDEFILYDPGTLDKRTPKAYKPDQKGWFVDYRRAVNHNKEKSEGGVGVVAIRPKWKAWGGFLTLEVDMDFFKTLDGITGLLNVAGHYFGIGCGRQRIKATVRQKPVWSGCGLGKYSAELMGGK